MTHEFKEIITSYEKARQQGILAVMATVVDVEGSSYRRPGVGMLILQNGVAKGAVSGGCVEKEVLRQSQSVFQSGIPKIMTYDGKYRLGCEGILYILIEPFDIDETVIDSIKKHLSSRKPFEITSYFSKTETNKNMGSVIQFEEEQKISFSSNLPQTTTLPCFQRIMEPCFRLIIIGAEHDAVVLCQLASVTGWEIEVVSTPQSPKQLKEFPGANKIHNCGPEDVKLDHVDDQTAIILMTHNFAKDVLYLQALKEYNPIYIGLLGPARRREKLISAFIEYHPEISEEFLDILHGPAGLNLGAETPQEIAIAIIAEILSVIRNQKPIPLQDKKGAIHDDVKRKHLNVLSNKT